ncbi:uncharacterized protein LOC122577483 [Bombus pyrosoma]|nr:uncharacterized protein LOC122577483 [Bombus pyrosoma]
MRVVYKCKNIHLTSKVSSAVAKEQVVERNTPYNRNSLKNLIKKLISTKEVNINKNIYKMKAVMFIFVMLATICAILAFVPYNPPRPGQSKPFPSFPGHGPFNPKIQWPYPLPNPGH